jgi:hypothetical protein
MLDAFAECDCMASMKVKIFAVLIGVALLAAGCVDTVTGDKTMGVPFIKDKIQSRYDRPADQVFEAAKEVIKEDGVLVNEGTLYNQTNAVGNVIKTVRGKVNERTVWVAVEQVDPKITGVSVQTRTPGGTSDIDLAAEIDKQIALKLVH